MATTGAANQKLKVFISYSRKDEDFAQDLLAGLQVASSPTSTGPWRMTLCATSVCSANVRCHQVGRKFRDILFEFPPQRGIGCARSCISCTDAPSCD
jgi:hypothetical protein